MKASMASTSLSLLGLVALIAFLGPQPAEGVRCHVCSGGNVTARTADNADARQQGVNPDLIPVTTSPEYKDALKKDCSNPTSVDCKSLTCLTDIVDGKVMNKGCRQDGFTKGCHVVVPTPQKIETCVCDHKDDCNKDPRSGTGKGSGPGSGPKIGLLSLIGLALLLALIF